VNQKHTKRYYNISSPIESLDVIQGPHPKTMWQLLYYIIKHIVYIFTKHPQSTNIPNNICKRKTNITIFEVMNYFFDVIFSMTFTSPKMGCNPINLNHYETLK